MKISKRNPKGRNRTEFSEGFLSEFALQKNKGEQEEKGKEKGIEK